MLIEYMVVSVPRADLSSNGGVGLRLEQVEQETSLICSRVLNGLETQVTSMEQGMECELPSGLLLVS